MNSKYINKSCYDIMELCNKAFLADFKLFNDILLISIPNTLVTKTRKIVFDDMKFIILSSITTLNISKQLNSNKIKSYYVINRNDDTISYSDEIEDCIDKLLKYMENTILSIEPKIQIPKFPSYFDQSKYFYNNISPFMKIKI